MRCAAWSHAARSAGQLVRRRQSALDDDPLRARRAARGSTCCPDTSGQSSSSDAPSAWTSASQGSRVTRRPGTARRRRSRPTDVGSPSGPHSSRAGEAARCRATAGPRPRRSSWTSGKTWKPCTRSTDADLAARVAREAGVAARVDVARAHAVADRERVPRAWARGAPGPPRASVAGTSSRVQHPRRASRARPAAAPAPRARSRSRSATGTRPAAGSRGRSASCRCSTSRRRRARSTSASTRRSHSAWKSGSSTSAHDRPEAVHAAHVVRAVHSSPTPIIESRVTTRGQLLLGPPVGARRAHRQRPGTGPRRSSPTRGRTRRRPASTPKSASTPRGSDTARER